MKLTLSQAEAKLTKAWGKQAHVVAYNMYGGLTYAATDYGSHWIPLSASWAQRRQVFEPVGMDWPSQDNGAWVKAVTEAAELARSHFINQRNMDALKRLPRAQVIAEARNWVREDDGHDTWLIPSSSHPSAVYEVNQTCTCPDYQRGGAIGGWCKHRLARALGRKAETLLQKGKGAKGGRSTSAPAVALKESHSQPYSTMVPPGGQSQRIDLTVAYEASEDEILPSINCDGLLIEFRADGEVVRRPAESMKEMYRWLRDHGYVPYGFLWLGWEGGLRLRRQTYVSEAHGG